MITDDHPYTPDTETADHLTATIDNLRNLAATLTDTENRLAAEHANVRANRIAAEKALATFTGETPKKRRGRPRKNNNDTA